MERLFDSSIVGVFDSSTIGDHLGKRLQTPRACNCAWSKEQVGSCVKSGSKLPPGP